MSPGAAAYDPATGATVLAYSDGYSIHTWTGNGSTWTDVSLIPTENNDGNPLLAYDGATAQVIMVLDDRTLAWTGSTWQQVADDSPVSIAYDENESIGDAGALAYDGATGQLVYVSGGPGYTGAEAGLTTWTWDGSEWTELAPSTSPSARSDPSLAYDSTSGDLVLFGGTATSPLGDTWLWNGSGWAEAYPTTSPSPRAGAAMVDDPSASGVILFGSEAANGETWYWNGSDWSEQAPSTIPTFPDGVAPHLLAMVYDVSTGEPVLVAGGGGEGIWAWTGNDWDDITPVDTSPPGGVRGTEVEDAFTGQFLDVAGGETFVRNEAADDWTLESTAPGGENSIAYDAATDQVIDFQQTDGDGNSTTNTWTWTGSAWSELTPDASPPVPANDGGYGWGYWAASLGYDSTSSQLILIEPVSAASTTTEETWSWDGSDWQQLAPADSPPPRTAASLSDDPEAGGLLLFGGKDSGDGILDADAWLWQDGTWTEEAPADSPPALKDASMAYDPDLSAVLLFGGDESSNVTEEDVQSFTYEFDGTDWQLVPTAESPATRSGAALAWDPAASQMLMTGGDGGRFPEADSWALTTGTMPAPTVTSVVGGNNEVTVTWTPAALGKGVDISWYLITASGNGGSEDAPAYDGDSFAFDTVTNGDTYTFTVQPEGPDGTYPVSAPSGPVTPVGQPGPPQSVSESCGNGTVTVSWQPPVPSSDAAPVTEYTIYPETGAPVTVPASTTSDTLTGFTNGDGPLTVFVSASNQFGASQRVQDPSSEDCTPYAPGGVPTLTGVAPAVGAVTVKWKPPATSALPVVGYEITGSGTSTTVGPSATSATVAVSDDRIYLFTVSALTSDGEAPPSDVSAPVMSTPPAQNPVITSVTPGQESAVLGWAAPEEEASGVSGYRVFVSNGSIIHEPATARSLTVRGLTAGKTYSFTVAAVRSGAVATASPAKSARVPVPPGAPTITAASAGDADVTVTWKAPANDGGAALEHFIVSIDRCSVGTCVAWKTLTVAGSADTAVVHGLTPGQQYAFAVAATNVAGTGSKSAWLRATPRS